MLPCNRCGVRTSPTGTLQRSGYSLNFRICLNGCITRTYEISEAMFKAAQADFKKVAERGSNEYLQKIEARRKLKKEMLAARLRGMTCPQLSAQYGLSVDMVRYYTRLPRGRLYPSAKKQTP